MGKVVVSERGRTGVFLSSTTLYSISAQAKQDDVISIKVETPIHILFIVHASESPKKGVGHLQVLP